MLIIEEIIREVRIHSPPWAAKTLVRTSFCLREARQLEALTSVVALKSMSPLFNFGLTSA